MNALVHYARFLARRDAPATQVTAAEREALHRHSEGARTLVEIGCYEGSTTALLAKGRNNHVHSIDPFFRGRIGISYGKAIAETHLRREGIHNVTLHEGFSYDVAPTFREPIDFLFIDADHSYEGVKRDWNDWAPKVRVGGILAMHDSRIAPNSPVRAGSMDFYEKARKVSAVTELSGVDSLALFQVAEPVTVIP